MAGRRQCLAASRRTERLGPGQFIHARTAGRAARGPWATETSARGFEAPAARACAGEIQQLGELLVREKTCGWEALRTLVQNALRWAYAGA